MVWSRCHDPFSLKNRGGTAMCFCIVEPQTFVLNHPLKSMGNVPKIPKLAGRGVSVPPPCFAMESSNKFHF